MDELWKADSDGSHATTADNEIKNWNYVKLAESLDHGCGQVYAVRVTTEEECEAAMRAAVAMPDKAVLIEAVVDKDDCSVEVLQLGKLMANRNK